MDLLKPPTENSYTYMIGGGIILAVCCLIFPVLFFHRTGMEYLAQLGASKELQVHEKFATERLATLDTRKQHAGDERNKLQEQLDTLKSGSNVPGNFSEVDKLETRIKEANREIESIENTSYELRLNLELRRTNTNHGETVIKNRSRDSRVFMKVGGITALICLFVSLIGLRHWLKGRNSFKSRVVVKEAEAQPQAKIEADNKVEQATPVSRQSK